ncbi:hypothetical protein C2845_PM06G27590 [Panicum miliaceum]|uniref:Uncharacterized protein n=1 Tax=Panicum miliaceum TaxID=4540 RepID=A0A3L6RFZ6_PANMI|nr:hypothetical protein C2845_PM06G27590 [Panicum miliaceum]
MWGLKQVATTATNLPDKSCMQLSPPLMLSLIHHYSSKVNTSNLRACTFHPNSSVAKHTCSCCPFYLGGEPRLQQPIDRKVMQNLKQGEQGCYTIAYNKIDIVEWFLDGLEKDLNVCNKMMSEALDTYDKGFQLLDKGLDSQAFAILEKVLDDILEGINASEKWLDYFATTIGNSKRLPPDMLELNQKFYKELDEYHKNLRQGQKKLSSSIKNLKKLKKLTKVLNAVSIGLGAYLLLLLMFSIGIY